ncbi:MAG TPA: ABC transporter ATP-binding protein [Candidatus Polarisedimenticolia bacterium]|nr:ABC transporter ATP-binding protein [Candidatus Polarisedimenticolia bacterium]
MTGPASPPAVELLRVSRHFGGFAALDGVDLGIGTGERILLLGPNGAGKTTLLRMLALLVRPTGGTLRLFGEPTRRGGDRPARRRRIGFLAHQTWLYEHLTAEENLRFTAGLYDLPAPEAAIRRALDEVGLLHRRGDTIRTFSRGMQQRLALARVLLTAPDLLLLDEPFTGLDRQGAGALRLLVRERLPGRTLVLATHDIADALPLVDRVVVLAGGRVAADRPITGLAAAAVEAIYQDATAHAAGAA